MVQAAGVRTYPEGLEACGSAACSLGGVTARPIAAIAFALWPTALAAVQSAGPSANYRHSTGQFGAPTRCRVFLRGAVLRNPRARRILVETWEPPDSRIGVSLVVKSTQPDPEGERPLCQSHIDVHGICAQQCAR